MIGGRTAALARHAPVAHSLSRRRGVRRRSHHHVDLRLARRRRTRGRAEPHTRRPRDVFATPFSSSRRANRARRCYADSFRPCELPRGFTEIGGAAGAPSVSPCRRADNHRRSARLLAGMASRPINAPSSSRILPARIAVAASWLCRDRRTTTRPSRRLIVKSVPAGAHWSPAGGARQDQRATAATASSTKARSRPSSLPHDVLSRAASPRRRGSANGRTRRCCRAARKAPGAAPVPTTPRGSPDLAEPHTHGGSR